MIIPTIKRPGLAALLLPDRAAPVKLLTTWGVVACSVVMCMLLSFSAAANSLQSVSARNLANGATEVVLQLDESPLGRSNRPTSFTIDDPAKIVLDLPGCTSNVSLGPQPLAVGSVLSYRASAISSRVRVVIDLQRTTPHKTRIEGNKLIVAIGAAPAVAEASNRPQTPAAAVASPPVAANSALSLDIPASVAPFVYEPTAHSATEVQNKPVAKASSRPAVKAAAPQPTPLSIEPRQRVSPLYPPTPPAPPVPLPRLASSASRLPAQQAIQRPVARAPAPSPMVSSTAANRPSDDASVQQIDFRRSETGAGRIILDLTDPGAQVNVTKRSGKLVATVTNTELPKALARSYDVLDFGTPVRKFDVRQRRGAVEIKIDAFGDYDYIAFQTNSRLVLEVRPLTQAQIAERVEEGPQYDGARINLNFQNIEIRRLLQVLADFAEVNIVVSDTVQGTIAMRLVNVPWDQALDIVLQTKGLDQRREGNVILVDSVANIAARELAERQAREVETVLAPLRTELIQINYARAQELADLFTTNNQRGRANQNTNNRNNTQANDGDSGILSPRGSIAVDERTNTLIVQDSSDRIANVRRLVEKLDIPVRQVLIESRIVVANDDFSKDIGVRFGVTAVDRLNNGGIVAFTGSQTGVNDIIDSRRDGENPLDIPGSGGSALANRFGVNLPAIPTGASPGQIGFAFLARDILVDLELSALQAEGNGELLSTPRVITANQREARIEQGVEIPFQQATSSGATAVSFKKAVLSLTVTPQITPDNRIILDLDVTSDARGQETAAGPAIDTRQVQTQVLVNNGETVVLGGIYEQDKRETTTKVPLLGDIPYVGRLFRRNSTINRKRELLIFVTPKIIDDQLSLER